MSLQRVFEETIAASRSCVQAFMPVNSDRRRGAGRFTTITILLMQRIEYIHRQINNTKAPLANPSSDLVSGRPRIGLARVVCTDELGLVLLRIFRLTEGEATVSPHTLGGANLLDGFLEPKGRSWVFASIHKKMDALLLSWTVIRNTILLKLLSDMVR